MRKSRLIAITAALLALARRRCAQQAASRIRTAPPASGRAPFVVSARCLTRSPGRPAPPAAAPVPTFAGDSRTDAALKKLDPDTRLAEACNLAAMDRIVKDRNAFRPEHVAVDQISPPQRSGDTLEGSGGAFRSGGDWYRLSFKCTASHDHMRVLSFSYKVGQKVPKSQWSSFNLYP